MGITGRFRDLLKPCARWEDVDFLRDNWVAVDLSLWVVQHQTAIGGRARNPHLCALFFRTVNLFAKELFGLMGKPVLKADAEAEAPCARLNGEGHLDACITSDSDAFLYGAQCVVKSLRPNTKCYHVSDIEAGLGLGRKQLVAMALFVGNDRDLVGVPGIGVETTLCFIQQFSDDEVLCRLQEAEKNGSVK